MAKKVERKSMVYDENTHEWPIWYSNESFWIETIHRSLFSQLSTLILPHFGLFHAKFSILMQLMRCCNTQFSLDMKLFYLCVINFSSSHRMCGFFFCCLSFVPAKWICCRCSIVCRLLHSCYLTAPLIEIQCSAHSVFVHMPHRVHVVV